MTNKGDRDKIEHWGKGKKLAEKMIHSSRIIGELGLGAS